MILRLGFLVAASVAAYAVKQIAVNRLTKPSGGSTMEKEEEESILILTDSVISKNLYEIKSDSARMPEVDDMDEDKELERLRGLVKEMEETQENQKRKLLVYYGLKEQEEERLQLKPRLQMKTVEINKLNLTVGSLRAENINSQEETLQCVLIKKQLEEARIKINELQQQIRTVADQRKLQIMMLKEQLETIQADDNPRSDVEIQKKFETGNDLQLEVTALRRRHRELQLENRVLTIKIVVAEARANAILNMTESEVMKTIRVQADASRLDNEDLQKQVESLQKDRFHAVEELVYQRWVNACLRHEIQSYQRTSISDSQQTSAENNVRYNPFEDNSRSETTRTGRKTSLIRKLKRWRRSFDTSSVVSSLNRSFGSSSRRSSSSESATSRRSSFSIGSFGSSALKHLRDRSAVEKSSSDSPDTLGVTFRRRRVSFNDSLNTTRTLPQEQYTNNDCDKIFTEPIKESDEVKTDSFPDDPDSDSASETGEPLLPQFMPSSSETNIDGSNATTSQEESEIQRSADHTEIMVKPRELHSDALFLFFIGVVIILYLFLHIISVF